MTVLAVDTSVAIPLLVRTHTAHQAVARWWGGRDVSLSGHAAVETYAVLTRLPADLRVLPDDAAQLMADRFAGTLLIGAQTAAAVPTLLSSLGVGGGAAYDGLVALAAREHGATLATRDARALATYERIGVQVEVVPAA